MFFPGLLAAAALTLPCSFASGFVHIDSSSRLRIRDQAGLTEAQVNAVRAKLLEIAHFSWELGTATEALLELDEPQLSVYGDHPFPPPYLLSQNSPIVTIAKNIIDNKPNNTKALMTDGAAGDPASNGIAVILAGLTYWWDGRFRSGAEDQLYHLLYEVPRVPNGAISHRESEAQLWDDSVYMAPPFIAYYGAFCFNQTLVAEGANQVRLYREVLQDPATKLWKHILLGGWSEPSLWGTGNAWAAAGTLRVLQTILKSPFAWQLKDDAHDLVDYATEIISAGWSYQKPNGTLYNHPAVPEDQSFPDSSWTALLAATTYRLAKITGDKTWIPNASLAFDCIKASIDSDGLLHNVVDVFQWSQRGTQSPEGQAFVLLLQAAWRDFNAWEASGAPPTISWIPSRSR